MCVCVCVVPVCTWYVSQSKSLVVVMVTVGEAKSVFGLKSRHRTDSDPYLIHIEMLREKVGTFCLL